MAVDGASLLAAAIRAACHAGALRRTVQAVASAVTAILVRPVAAVPRRESRSPAGAPGDAAGEADDAPAWLASLRAVRQAQRARKKERRRAATRHCALHNYGGCSWPWPESWGCSGVGARSGICNFSKRPFIQEKAASRSTSDSARVCWARAACCPKSRVKLPQHVCGQFRINESSSDVRG